MYDFVLFSVQKDAANSARLVDQHVLCICTSQLFIERPMQQKAY